MASTKAIVGGGLIGLGQGLVQRAEALRLAGLERAKELRRQLEKEDDRAYEAQVRKEEQTFRRGLLTRVEEDENRNLIGVTQGGETKNLGVRVAPDKDAKDAGGLTAADQRLWNVVKDKHTRKGLEGETTDWSAMARELAEVHSRPDLAKLAMPGDAGTDGIDVESPEYRKAEEMADAWVSEQAGFFSRDKSDFKDFAGNRESARQAKTLEFYRQLTGQGGGSTVAREGSESSQKPSKAATSSQTPPGSGTQSDPYRATTQAQVDWFKSNAPVGAILEVNGKLYQK